MGTKRYKPKEIVRKLKQVKILAGKRLVSVDAIRQVCIGGQTHYRLRKQYVSMEKMRSKTRRSFRRKTSGSGWQI